MEPGLLPHAQLGTPLSISATEYHFLALYPDRVRCLSRLSGDVVQDLPLPPALAAGLAGPAAGESAEGRPGAGLVRDEATNALWIWAGGGLWQVSSGARRAPPPPLGAPPPRAPSKGE